MARKSPVAVSSIYARNVSYTERGVGGCDIEYVSWIDGLVRSWILVSLVRQRRSGRTAWFCTHRHLRTDTSLWKGMAHANFPVLCFLAKRRLCSRPEGERPSVRLLEKDGGQAGTR